MSPAALFAPMCSVTSTKRRRFLWAAWWTRQPERSPFVKPDASSGGARTREEALQQAEKAAGRQLNLVDGSWARAWARVLAGEPAFARPDADEAPRKVPTRPAVQRSAADILGVAPHATLDEVKRAYRRRALETHPDRGGSAEAFREVHAAFERLEKRRQPKKKR